MKVSVKSIELGPNIRDEQADEVLLNSINVHGLINPLTVRMKNGDGTGYVLIAGGRRLDAIKKLGWKDVEVCIVDIADENLKAFQTVENTARKDMTLQQEVEAIRLYLTEKGLSIDAIAKLFGHSEGWVRYRLKFANLLPEMFNILDEKTAKDLSIISSYSGEVQKKGYNETCELYEFDGADLEKWLFEEEVETIEFVYNIRHRIEEEEVQFQIEQLPWTSDDERFGPTCTGCIYRSSRQLGVFAEIMSDTDRCTNNDCLAEKVDKIIEFFQEKETEHGVKADENLAYSTRWLSRSDKVVDKVIKSLDFSDLMKMTDEEIDELFTQSDYWTGACDKNSGRMFRGDETIRFVTARNVKGSEDSSVETTEEGDGDFSLSERTKKKLYRFLHPIVCDALFNRLVDLEPNLDGGLTYRLMGYALFYSDTHSRFSRDRYSGYTTGYSADDWFDHPEGIETGMRNFHRRFVISILREYLSVKSLNVLIGDGFSVYRDYYDCDEEESSHYLKTDESIAQVDGGKARFPNVAKVLNFDFHDWFAELMKDEDRRKFVIGLFTKKELLFVLTDEEKKGVASKSKNTVVNTVTGLFPKDKEVIPFYTDVFVDDTEWMGMTGIAAAEEAMKLFFSSEHLSEMATQLAKM